MSELLIAYTGDERSSTVSLLADRCSPSSEAMEYVGGVELAADKMTG